VKYLSSKRLVLTPRVSLCLVGCLTGAVVSQILSYSLKVFYLCVSLRFFSWLLRYVVLFSLSRVLILFLFLRFFYIQHRFAGARAETLSPLPQLRRRPPARPPGPRARPPIRIRECHTGPPETRLPGPSAPATLAGHPRKTSLRKAGATLLNPDRRSGPRARRTSRGRRWSCG